MRRLIAKFNQRVGETDLSRCLSPKSACREFCCQEVTRSGAHRPRSTGIEGRLSQIDESRSGAERSSKGSIAELIYTDPCGNGGCLIRPTHVSIFNRLLDQFRHGLVAVNHVMRAAGKIGDSGLVRIDAHVVIEGRVHFTKMHGPIGNRGA